MDKSMVENLIRLEYSEFERDDIKIETYKHNAYTNCHFLVSYHKRDTTQKYAKYWVWDAMEKKLTRDYVNA